MQGLMVENIRTVGLAVPVNTTGAAVASPWINMGVGRRIQFNILTGAWAGGTPAVTINQATSAAGAGSKAVSFDYYWLTTSVLVSDSPVRTAVVANTFNIAAAANNLYQIEIRNQDLDINNGFTFCQLAVASPGANTDLISAWANLYDLKYAGNMANMPSSLV